MASLNLLTRKQENYKNNNKIIYHADYYMVINTIETLNNKNIDKKNKFQKQKSTLATDFSKT